MICDVRGKMRQMRMYFFYLAGGSQVKYKAEGDATTNGGETTSGTEIALK